MAYYWWTIDNRLQISAQTQGRGRNITLQRRLWDRHRLGNPSPKLAHEGRVGDAKCVARMADYAADNPTASSRAGAAKYEWAGDAVQ